MKFTESKHKTRKGKPRAIYYFVRPDGLEESFRKFYSQRYHCHYFVRRNPETGWVGIYNYNSGEKVWEYGPSGTINREALSRIVYKGLKVMGVKFDVRINRSFYNKEEEK